MTDGSWPAPLASHPVDAVVEVPGSKSLTNRGLVLAAIAAAPSVLRRPLRARDTVLMADALRSLGAVVDDDGDDWHVHPSMLAGPADIDCGLAGTVMRFLPPVAALATGVVRFDGDPRARERPMGTILAALRMFGVEIDDGGREALPFAIDGKGSVAGGDVIVDASASSQFVSGLLLAGARYEKGLTVRHDGKPLPSHPHVNMTVATLREAGVEVDDSEVDTWRVEPGPIGGLDLDVEPDLSSAAPFLAAALAAGGVVRVPGWPRSTTQAGARLPELLTLMGGECLLDPGGIVVRGTGRLDGLDADLHDVGELTPVLAALAALAGSRSHLKGVAHLRGHETDRLAALASELNRLGSDVVETDDGLVIRPRPLHGGVFRTYADHRLAQAGAVLGLAVPGLEVDDVATTAKTLPDFPAMWLRMLEGGG